MKPTALVTREDAVAEELERQDRLGRAALDEARTATSEHDAERRSARRSPASPRRSVVPPRLVKSTIADSAAGEQRRRRGSRSRAGRGSARAWKTARDHDERERRRSAG